MFTGLVEGLGRVLDIEKKGLDLVLFIKPFWSVEDTKLGESISTNGICLTVISVNDDGFFVDVSMETVSCTNISYLKVRDIVNLERSLTLNDRLGGHLVSGHVDCLGSVKRIKKAGSSTSFLVEIPDSYSNFIIEKGSVSLNGISLTVNMVKGNVFELNIIPHTLLNTNLQFMNVNDYVNIETDLIGKYLYNFLVCDKNLMGKDKNLITKEYLLKMGF